MDRYQPDTKEESGRVTYETVPDLSGEEFLAGNGEPSDLADQHYEAWRDEKGLFDTGDDPEA